MSSLSIHRFILTLQTLIYDDDMIQITLIFIHQPAMSWHDIIVQIRITNPSMTFHCVPQELLYLDRSPYQDMVCAPLHVVYKLGLLPQYNLTLLTPYKSDSPLSSNKTLYITLISTALHSSEYSHQSTLLLVEVVPFLLGGLVGASIARCYRMQHKGRNSPASHNKTAVCMSHTQWNMMAQEGMVLQCLTEG